MWKFSIGVVEGMRDSLAEEAQTVKKGGRAPAFPVLPALSLFTNVSKTSGVQEREGPPASVCAGGLRVHYTEKHRWTRIRTSGLEG